MLLVERGLAPTRSRARDAIRRGCVTVSGETATKPGLAVDETSLITLDDAAAGYVSRAALKLIGALDAFGFDPKDRIALDIGTSTGGFTQVLLERGASHVTAVDVGHGQLDGRLARDPRVSAFEGTDARDLTAAMVDGPITAIVADLSFISLTKALAPSLDLAAAGCWLVALVKPQFEAGPQAVGKGGVVRDPAVQARAAETVRVWLEGRPGWTVSGLIESPVAGADGNRELLIGARFAV